MAARIFIDGEAGTTGLGVAGRLGALRGVELIQLDERLRKDASARVDAMAAADVTVLCLPDEAARAAVAAAPPAARILDASTAHRTAPGWVYGLPELGWTQAAKVAAAPRVSNPGCYATGAILPLYPLVAAGILPPGADITISAVSGYSGGGKAMITAHLADGGPAFELYGLGMAHKHVPEIMAVAGLTRRPVFLPSVGHFRQGMLVCIPLFLDRLPGLPSPQIIRDVLTAHYREARLVTVLGAPDTLDPETLNDTDKVEIFCAARDNQAVLIARLDNLGKGASGAAVQNLKLMLQLDEGEI